MKDEFRKQIEELLPETKSLMLKNGGEILKEVALAVLGAHKAALTVKNTGVAVGRAARNLVKPCLEFWNGIKEGFNKPEEEENHERA